VRGKTSSRPRKSERNRATFSALDNAGEKTDEPFIGELTGKDNRSFVFADTDGFWNGQLDGDDTLSFCYMHTGGKSRSTVVSCTEVKRTR
jgi:hypothetical protein